MKFLIITNHSYMLWQFRRELIKALLQRGKVVISTPFVGHEHDFLNLGCRCVETKMERRGVNPLQEIKLLRTYRKLLKDEKPDLVITYSIKPNLYAGLICRYMRIRYCSNVQGLGTAFQSKKMAALISILYRTALKRAEIVFFENQANAELFVKRGILSAESIILLPGAGVNLEQYSFKPYPPEDKGIRFLYLGRIMREKGMDELLTVIRRLKAEFRESVQFDLVGFFEDDYKQAVQEMEKKGVLHFHGFQADPKPYYETSHCVVLPSWHEGMSNVLLEAAAIGRPLITTDIPGCREAVEEGENGYLVKIRDENSLYSAMRRFIALNLEERVAMGRRGREKMQQEFDRRMVVEKIICELQI